MKRLICLFLTGCRADNAVSRGADDVAAAASAARGTIEAVKPKLLSTAVDVERAVELVVLLLGILIVLALVTLVHAVRSHAKTHRKIRRRR